MRGVCQVVRCCGGVDVGVPVSVYQLCGCKLPLLCGMSSRCLLCDRRPPCLRESAHACVVTRGVVHMPRPHFYPCNTCKCVQLRCALQVAEPPDMAPAAGPGLSAGGMQPVASPPPVELPTPPAGSDTPVAATAGGVAAAVVLLLLILAVFLYKRKAASQRKQKTSVSQAPPVGSPPPGSC